MLEDLCLHDTVRSTLGLIHN